MKLLWVMAAVIVLPAQAESFSNYPDLPPTEMVSQALSGYAPVLAANAGVEAGAARAKVLRAGSYEYNVSLGSQRRRVQADPSQRFHEWDVGLERSFRLPGKSALDSELGEQQIMQAKLAQGDALHEAGITLLKLWFAWLREHYQVAQWQQQVEALGQQAGIAEKRKKAGDAPALEVLMAQSALAQAESSLKQAQMREQMAAADIGQRFPSIRLPASPALSNPQPMAQTLDYWKEEILQHNHELGLMRGESKQAQLRAARAQADRMPDPTVGIRYANERGGEERVAGLSFSIPLPGGARSASADGAKAEAEMLTYREAAALARLNAEIIKLYESTRASYSIWEKSRQVSESMRHGADLMSRAYALGEIGLSEVLLAQRQAIEAKLGAILAQLDTLEGGYRLKLDAHQLWPLDND